MNTARDTIELLDDDAAGSVPRPLGSSKLEQEQYEDVMAKKRASVGSSTSHCDTPSSTNNVRRSNELGAPPTVAPQELQRDSLPSRIEFNRVEFLPSLDNERISALTNDIIAHVETSRQFVPEERWTETNSSIHIPEAFLVEDKEEEVFVAETFEAAPPWWKHSYVKLLLMLVLISLTTMAVTLGVMLSSNPPPLVMRTEEPSSYWPTFMPTTLPVGCSDRVMTSVRFPMDIVTSTDDVFVDNQWNLNACDLAGLTENDGDRWTSTPCNTQWIETTFTNNTFLWEEYKRDGNSVYLFDSNGRSGEIQIDLHKEKVIRCKKGECLLGGSIADVANLGCEYYVFCQSDRGSSSYRMQRRRCDQCSCISR